MRPDPETRVLVVDDNPDARGFLTRALGSEAMLVHAAADGNAALDALMHFAPDAVLLDVDMPGMDGFATCERIMDRHGDLAVIFMTGLGDTGHIVRGFEVGACDYVTKPVEIAEVVARVRSHASKARLARSAREAIFGSTVPMLAAAGGRIAWINGSAVALLEAVGWPPCKANDPLPAGLSTALADTGAPWHGLRLRPLTADTADVVVVELARADLPTRATEASSLTPREAEVMLWVARGKTNRDVAEILGMSPRTVNKHLEHVYEKLGVETRTAAVAAAQRCLMAS
ncbi:response regulator transcription factor [Cupriavidus plantarum]|uniref:LuxR family two component transcriptional regulator n=1 Tax=Cupriavidus plantarum TaxID=942865 RepID=A0A316EWZ7_9BURK|nr:response regulator transcription factor [Cupriavidus plantarum]PWK37247.1 LuxR family two component transcriptional regulator [Cupriavidus plantarum]REF02016.1 LuxR family two component transcriptional regulator [Cupriavidus plantarum]RLK45137.1 LuxR family two component transcriptional regulator [Cupriavidus plantarum]CAG2129303.1 Protein-glutamate methylesterase/protein-glutamine glutaminase [Cupriavidus plantarum]SMR66329.1 two component transcriptional regulator, LuxR family [Cupriavidu